MKRHIAILLVPGLFATAVIVHSCKKKSPAITNYTGEVSVDINANPHPKLSDYHFFIGEMKNQIPAPDVIPFAPATPLFTDYALKKRFMWIPKGSKATYTADNQILQLPVGSVLIKSFYYQNMLPSGKTRILETRLMIRKANGWIFANYKWNDDQTEAYYTTAPSNIPISWIQNGKIKNTTYRIPSETECFICHKKQSLPTPIGIKPQNLNWEYTYKTGKQNQLHYLIREGYLENTLPQQILSTVNYKDHSQPVELRLRSYLDMNCAHCHAEGGHCDYRPMRLAFSETVNPVNIGLCVTPDEMVSPKHTAIVNPDSPETSVMYLRLSSNQANLRMPLIGRTIVHEEALQLLEEWIHSRKTCP